MSVGIVIVGDSPVKVWSLYGAERLRRQLAGLGGIAGITTGMGAPPAEGTLVLLRGDHAFDVRVLKGLIDAEGELLLRSGAIVVAVRASHEHYDAALAYLEGEPPAGGAGALPVLQPADFGAGFQKSLRKVEAPQVLPITAEEVRTLEARLFGGAYKGVTDLVTKWLWPIPARWATRLCAQLGILPNHVTLFGLVLAILATLGFWLGAFGTALLLAWLMTFLDTVDGKLARVTVTSSRFGDILDHGIDLLHPPIWYAAWGLGCAGQWHAGISVETALWLMLWGYLGGRLCEGAFHLLVGPFSMFVWRPFDSINRLVTARRNPNLILLTLSWLAGRPDLGLVAVVLWHLLSTAILVVRLCVGVWARLRHGPQRSWLAGVDPAGPRSLAVRIFA